MSRWFRRAFGRRFSRLTSPSRRRTSRRSTKHQDRRVESLESRCLLTLTFQFNYPGGPVGSGTGFQDASQGQARRDALTAAANQLGSMFAETATITMDATNLLGLGIAQADSNFVATTPGFRDNEVILTKAQTGIDGNGIVADGFIGIDWGQTWELSPNVGDVSGSEYDFYSIVQHELLHALGFGATPDITGSDNFGTLFGVPAFWNRFDEFVTDSQGTPAINQSLTINPAVWVTESTGGPSPAGGLFFSGPRAMVVNNNQRVGLYTPPAFEDGVSVRHLDDQNPLLASGNHWMLATRSTGPGVRDLTALDQAILEDIGYTITAPPMLIVTETAGGTEVSEDGTTDQFSVSLSAQPASNVVVTLTASDPSEATNAPTTLIFNRANWNVARSVIVTGVDDAQQDGDQTSQIVVSVDDALSDDAWDGVADEAVDVLTIDNDSPGIRVAQTNNDTIVSESGTDDTFDVSLNIAPAGTVVIDVASDDPGEATADVTSLTFTPQDWDQPQTVTITGVDDPVIDGDQVSLITLSVDPALSSSDYDNVNDRDIPVITEDDDGTPGFVVTQSNADTVVSETGTTDSFDISLRKAPMSNVVIRVMSEDTGEVVPSFTAVTFTPSTWFLPRTVTVTGIDDRLLDGDQLTNIVLSIDDFLSDDEYDPLEDQIVVVTTIDDDAPGITVSESDDSTVVSEDGNRDSFTVVLDVAPVSPVIINVSSANVGEATVDPMTLTFTPDNWFTLQLVNVTGTDDLVIDGDQQVDITLSVDDALSDDNFDPLPDIVVTATNVDDDIAGFTVDQVAGSEVAESGTSVDFTVVLDAIPMSDVVINAVSGDTGEAIPDVAALTFTPANWDSPQTISISGVDDALIDGTQTTSITLSVDDLLSDDDFDPLADQTLTVTTTDDDFADYRITESDDSTVVSESGTTDTFTVELLAEPDSDVVFNVLITDAGEAVPDATRLTFEPGNWNVPQILTVTGVDDPVIDGTQESNLIFAINDGLSDDHFDLLPNATFTVSTVDDEAAGITVTETNGGTTVDETGSTDTFDVVLDAPPNGTVVLDVIVTDPSELSTSDTTLTFSPLNWAIPQVVTVTGLDDQFVDNTVQSEIRMAINFGQTDNSYLFVPDAVVGVSSLDNDMAGFSVAETDGVTVVSETGTSDTFTIVLDQRPLTNVVFDIITSDFGEASPSQISRTFTPSNWDVPQTIIVAPGDDFNVDGNQVTTITVSVDDDNSDDAFDALPDQAINVTTLDNDVAGITVVESNGSTAVAEQGPADSFTVVLDTAPTTDVVIQLTNSDTTETQLDASQLRFTPNDWNQPQTVSVSGVDEDIIDGDQTTTITLSVNDAQSDATYDDVNNLTVLSTTVNDDFAGFTVVETGGSTTVTEAGASDSFSVTLDARPLTNVTIDITSPATDEVTIDRTQLVFVPASWDTPQTVTVTGVNDTIVDNDQTTNFTLSVNDTASDNDFDAVANQVVSVVTTDDDGIPRRVVLTGPNAPQTRRPTVTWNPIDGVTGYDLWMNRVGVQSEFIREMSLTTNSFTPSSDLPDGRFRVWVQAYNDAGRGLWSRPIDFVLGVPIPGRTTITGPSGSAIGSRPTITWDEASDATEYDLWVNEVGGTAQIIREQNLTSLSFTPSFDLPDGIFRAWVQPRNSTGRAPWSRMHEFLVGVPGVPVMLGPTGEGLSSQPTISWTAPENASSFDLWVNQLGGQSQVIREETLPSPLFTPETPLLEGTYRAWVRARNAVGALSNWSRFIQFTVGAPKPARPIVTGPSGTTTSSIPVVDWLAVPGATDYEVWINEVNPATGATVRSAVVRESGIQNTQLALGSITPSVSLTNGTYRTWVRARGADGTFGRWSAPRTFNVSVPVVASANLSAGSALDGVFSDKLESLLV